MPYYNQVNEVVLNYSSDNFIDGIVMDGNNPSWRLTGFCGEPSWERKHLSWTYLRDIHSNNAGPWLVIGDFNEITTASEKEGGNIRPQHFMQKFRGGIDECGLQEIMVIGDTFTWSRELSESDLTGRCVMKHGQESSHMHPWCMNTTYIQTIDQSSLILNIISHLWYNNINGITCLKVDG